MKCKRERQFDPTQLQLLFSTAGDLIFETFEGTPITPSSTATEPTTPTTLTMHLGHNEFDHDLAICNGTAVAYKRHILLRSVKWLIAITAALYASDEVRIAILAAMQGS